MGRNGHPLRRVGRRGGTRFDLFENRLERMDSRLARLEINFSSFHKALDGHERVLSGLLATQAAQQKAIDNIVDRLFGLEHRQ